MSSHQNARLAALLAGTALLLPVAAHAQQIGYGDTTSRSGSGGYSAQSASQADGASEMAAEGEGEEHDNTMSPTRTGGSSYRGVQIRPYIEAAQVVSARISPGSDVLTYSRVAAGADALFGGRNNQGAVSVRYEHVFGWGKKAHDYDQISGIARVRSRVAPGVKIEAGALAGQTTIETGQLATGSNERKSRVYSVFGGPTLEGKAGPVNLQATYRAGFTQVKAIDALVTGPGTAVDVKENTVVHSAMVRAGVNPGDVLPVGVAVIGTYGREDMQTLKQRHEDATVRGEVLAPLTSELAVVGSVGYEKVEISSRDAARDVSGNPIIRPNGQYAIDYSTPRRIAFETSGLMWDTGVIWRPSRRTNLEAHVGHRYGSMTYYGSFSYAPTARSNMTLSVYDRMSSFGGGLAAALEALPTEFTANRDPVTGTLNGCVASTKGNNCISSSLASSRNTAFRARGVSLAYGLDLGRIAAGLGMGYDRRKLIAAQGTLLAPLNGRVDENYWMAAYMNAKLTQADTLGLRGYANRQSIDGVAYGDSRNVGGSVSYGHSWTRGLSTTVGLGVEGLMRDDPAFADIWNASAVAGVRYTF